MIASLLERLALLITAVISAGGYGGVLLLMAIESACVPLPSEIIMPFAGYLVFRGQFSLQGAALAGALGCVAGSIPAYYLGAYGGRPLVERYGRYLLVSPAELRLADRLFERHGQWIVLAGRLLPIVRTFIAFPAGVSRMRMGRFLLYTFVGSYPWCYALAWVGMKLGERWNRDERLRAAFHRFDLAIALLLAAGAIWFVLHKWREARRGGSTSAEEG